MLGFVLPWILAMVAIPLEMLVDSGRHVVAQLAVALLVTLGNAVRVLGHVLSSLAGALPGIYDVYVAIPLRIERMLRGSKGGDGARRRGEVQRDEQLPDGARRLDRGVLTVHGDVHEGA